MGGVRVTVRIEAKDGFDKLVGRGRDLIGAVVARTSFAIQRGGQMRARVRYGQMKAGIKADVTRARTDLHGEVIGSAEHTIYNEMGTRYMTPQPMLGPATQEQAQPFAAGVTEAVNQAATEAAV